MSRILGLDYGERRIGIALSDPLQIIAKPLTVIDRKKNDYIFQLSKIIIKNEIISIVVGLPLTHMVPAVGMSRVAIARISVVLPEPLGPKIVRHSPQSNVNPTLRSAGWSWKNKLRSSASMALVTALFSLIS